MKKLLPAIIILIFLVLGVYSGSQFGNSGAQPIQPTPKVATENLPTPAKAPEVKAERIINDPVSLLIPKIGVRANVEYVGLDATGRMDVPRNVNNVAWYELGYKPGEKGNAVLAGHLDSQTGAPAVFYNISSLKPGDQIIIRGSNHDLEYRVTQIRNYPFNHFPLNDVFGSSEKTRLNLITCDGTFNSSTRNYSHRTVVYSELAK